MTRVVVGEADSFAALRNDSQKSKDKRRSRFPEGMKGRRAKADAFGAGQTWSSGGYGSMSFTEGIRM
jgi:hypothetical protein